MSSAVADFGVQMIVALILIFCNLATERTLRLTEGELIVISERLFIFYASGTNVFSLVQERYVAVVKPLKYFTFMSVAELFKCCNILRNSFPFYSYFSVVV